MAESYFSRPAIDLSSTLQQYAISEGIQTEVLQQEIYQNIPFTIPVISKGKETLTGYAKFGQELLSTFPVIQEQLSEQDGVSPSIGEVLEYSIDALICGGLENPSNIPAIELRKLEPEEALIHELMRNRKEILAIRTFRGLNKGLYVWALSHPFPQRAIAGVSLLADFLGNMREHGLEGNNAANISIFFDKKVSEMLLEGSSEASLTNSLSKAGFTVDEPIQALSSNLYNTEFNYANLEFLNQLLTNLSVAGGFAANSDVWKAISAFGLSAVISPWSEFLAMESEKLQGASRIARQSHLLEKMSQVRKQWAKRWKRNSTVSTFDQVIAAAALMTPEENVLPILAASSILASGMGNAPNIMNDLTLDRRTIHQATVLIDAVTADHTLITQRQWDDFCREKRMEPEYGSNAPNFANGLRFINFKAPLSTGEPTRIAPLTQDIPAGQVIVFAGSVGSGKSELVGAGLFHYTRPDGKMQIILNGELIGVTSLPNREAIKEYIAYVDTNTIPKEYTLIDLYKEIFNMYIYEKHPEYPDAEDALDWQTAINTSDNQLQVQLEKYIKLKEEGVTDLKKHLEFPPHMMGHIKSYFEERRAWTELLLQQSEGALSEATVHPDRLVYKLSSGEQIRASLLLAYLKVLHNPNKIALVLDEPLAKLDTDFNLDYQLNLIDEIRKLGVAVIIISHNHNKKIQERFGAKIYNMETTEVSYPLGNVYEYPDTSEKGMFVGKNPVLATAITLPSGEVLKRGTEVNFLYWRNGSLIAELDNEKVHIEGLKPYQIDYLEQAA